MGKLTPAFMMIFATTALGGCVLNSTYRTAMDNAKAKQKATDSKLSTTETERDEWKEKAEYTQGRLEEKGDELEARNSELTNLDSKLTASETSLASATAKTEELSAAVSDLGEKVDTLSAEEAKLKAEKKEVLKQRLELAQEVKDLQRLRVASESRNAEYKNLLSKLHKMIDAGDLQVKVRGGRMLVTMSSDVLFDPGQATLKEKAVESLKKLAKTLKTFKGRKFQVIGHSDNRPINDEKFASNWELSSQRAIEVTKILISAGVPARMLSSAGYAEQDPVVRNSSSRNRAKNRRVELVFMPKIEELPGFDEVLNKK